MIDVVIAKPTKTCNANCSYCGAALSAKGKWSFDQFKFYFDKLYPHLSPNATWIWHGGEPLMMGVQFYEKTYAYMMKKLPKLRISFQSNLLLYDKTWKDLLMQITGGALATSFDPDMKGRLYRGSAEAYTALFLEKMSLMHQDGFRLSIIGTYDDEMYQQGLHLKMMDFAISLGQHAPSLRFNYRYPAGRAKDEGVMMSPENYANLLIETFDKWAESSTSFQIFPQIQMLQLLAHPDIRSIQCPWTRSCFGHFMGIEADGSVFNCCTFSDTNEDKYRFGNLNTDSVEQLFNSEQARALKRARIHIDPKCRSCEFFPICHGGCARDAILYGKDLYESTFYCESWKKVFTHLKKALENETVVEQEKEQEIWSAYI
ncbi:MAG: radical SAM protein [Alphaproteobacteria bacterium]|nr:radical SAM protein [Alphaproteobacteria bacterium]